jgi:hypothetical protein
VLTESQFSCTDDNIISIRHAAFILRIDKLDISAFLKYHVVVHGNKFKTDKS